MRGGWLAVLLLVLPIVGGCAHGWDGDGVDPALAREVSELRSAMPTVRPRDEVVVLRYRVHNHDGVWEHSHAIGRSLYAERRTRDEDGQTYAFGEDRSGPWVQVGDGRPRTADPHWRRQIRTRASLYGLDFLHPEGAEEATRLPLHDEGFEYAYRAPGGRTITFALDGDDESPSAWDVLDAFGRLNLCDDVRWGERSGYHAPLSGSCSAIDAGGHHAIASWFELIDSHRQSVVPRWARPRGRTTNPACSGEVVELPIEEETRIHVPVGADGGPTIPFVLDSGAWHTVVDADVAQALGVVPTGEVPWFHEPPWLPAGTAWVGVADRLTIAGIHIDNARVLVMSGLGAAIGGGGLLGADFFRRFVIDVDTPERTLRIVPHDRFERPPDSTVFFAAGMGRQARVRAQVVGIDGGQMILDTGADVTAVVTSPAMAAARPRRRGSDVGPWLGDGVRSPDYLSDIDGLELGPFSFPSMPVWGRDRDRDRVGGDAIGLIGMGTMRHLRVAFDLRHRTIYASAGPGFQALARSGLELQDAEEPDGGAFVSRVVPGSRAWVRGVRAGDVLWRIDGIAVRGAMDARRALADHEGAYVRLGFSRRSGRRSVVVALRGPVETVDPLFPPRARPREHMVRYACEPPDAAHAAR